MTRARELLSVVALGLALALATGACGSDDKGSLFGADGGDTDASGGTAGSGTGGTGGFTGFDSGASGGAAGAGGAGTDCNGFGRDETCTTCLAEKCCDAAAACGGSAECSALVECVRPCSGGGNDDPCVQACVADHPTGLGEYNALVLCMAGDCAEACPFKTP